MHDRLASTPYEAFDLELDAEPVRPRTKTDEMIFHVYADEEWHRQTPAGDRTACGETFHSGFSPTRREELTGDLCPICFTTFELEQARIAKERAGRRDPFFKKGDF